MPRWWFDKSYGVGRFIREDGWMTLLETGIDAAYMNQCFEGDPEAVERYLDSHPQEYHDPEARR